MNDDAPSPGGSAPFELDAPSCTVDWVVVLNATKRIDGDRSELKLQLQGHQQASILSDVFGNLSRLHLELKGGNVTRLKDYPDFYDLRIVASGNHSAIESAHEFFELRPFLHQPQVRAERQQAGTKPVTVSLPTLNAPHSLKGMFECLKSSPHATGDIGYVDKIAIVAMRPRGGQSLILGQLIAYTAEDRALLEQRLKKMSEGRRALKPNARTKSLRIVMPWDKQDANDLTPPLDAKPKKRLDPAS